MVFLGENVWAGISLVPPAADCGLVSLGGGLRAMRAMLCQLACVAYHIACGRLTGTCEIRTRRATSLARHQC